MRKPRLDGTVERSHRADKEEFYQLLSYTGDVDLDLKLEGWQNFYNYHRPHSALASKTPYETLREKLNLNVADARVLLAFGFLRFGVLMSTLLLEAWAYACASGPKAMSPSGARRAGDSLGEQLVPPNAHHPLRRRLAGHGDARHCVLKCVACLLKPVPVEAEYL